MNLGQLRARTLMQLPQATGSTVTPAQVNDVLNHGCDEINLIAKCYHGTFHYDIPKATKFPYFSMSQICPGYLMIEKVGIWFFDTAGKSHYLYPKTKRWLDLKIRNWRDTSGSSVPTWYYIHEDEMGLYPYVNIAGTYIEIDAYAKCVPMTADVNFPWSNGATELTQLRAFDNALVAYAVWKLSPAVFDKEGRNAYKQEFIEEVKKAHNQTNSREDMTSDDDYYMRPDISTGFLPR